MSRTRRMLKKMKRRRRLRKMSLEAKGFPIEEGLVSSLGLFQVTHAYTNKIYVSRSNLIRSSHRCIVLLIADFRKHKQIFNTPFIPNPTSTVNVIADLADCRLITTKGLRDCEEEHGDPQRAPSATSGVTATQTLTCSTNLSRH
jgi:hypothetical protein